MTMRATLAHTAHREKEPKYTRAVRIGTAPDSHVKYGSSSRRSTKETAWSTSGHRLCVQYHTGAHTNAGRARRRRSACRQLGSASCRAPLSKLPAHARSCAHPSGAGTRASRATSGILSRDAGPWYEMAAGRQRVSGGHEHGANATLRPHFFLSRGKR